MLLTFILTYFIYLLVCNFTFAQTTGAEASTLTGIYESFQTAITINISENIKLTTAKHKHNCIIANTTQCETKNKSK